MPEMDPSTSDEGPTRGWLARHPGVLPLLAAGSFLGVVQAFALAWRNQALGWQAAVGMLKLGLLAGLVTVMLMTPVVLWLRRWQTRWRAGDAGGATWSLAFGLAAAIAGWMIADQWAAGPMVPSWLEPGVEGLAAVAAAFVTTWLRVPAPWVKAGAVAAPVLLVLSLLPVPGMAGPAPEAEPAPVPVSASAGQPDVVLVSIDTLRADRLGAYGRTPSITPEMDRIAAEGVVFSRTLASSPWTLPSVASILTGLPAMRHGAGMALGSGPTFLRSPLDAGLTTLAERFAAAGYRTGAVVANGFLSPQLGMNQGFQEFANPLYNASGFIFLRDVPLVRLLLAPVPDEKLGDFRAEGVTETALAWWAEKSDAPRFLWVHYIDPHTPFQADPSRLDFGALSAEMRQLQPEVLEDGTVVGEVFAGTSHVRGGMLWLGPEDRRRIEEYYDRAVHYVDQQVGRLFSALRERGGGRPVVAALTSDHGEEFWDHGHFEHGHDYYREVTRVPLLFWCGAASTAQSGTPCGVATGRVTSLLAGLVDVGPTLLDLAGLEAPAAEAPDEGRSLAPLWRTAEPGPEASSPPRFAGGNLYDLPAVMVEDGPWRSILRANGTQELYDVARDPQERQNLAHEYPETAERLRRALQPRLDIFLRGGTDQGPAELSPETLEALRSLGYIQ
jgi:arylsulfatase A-like enzyme